MASAAVFSTAVGASANVLLVKAGSAAEGVKDWETRQTEAGATVTVLDNPAEITLDPSVFDEVFLAVGSDANDKYTHAGLLPALASALKPDSRLVLREVGTSDKPARDAASLNLELTLAGFVTPTEVASGEGSVEVTGATPAWEVGATESVKVTKSSKESRRQWRVAAITDTGSDLEDEDDLLKDDVVAPKSDCKTRRRACVGCSCGRAEELLAEERAAATKVTIDLGGEVSEPSAMPSSACGNCYRGDAFRCATCPYLGKPAFTPGMGGAMKLDMTDEFS